MSTVHTDRNIMLTLTGYGTSMTSNAHPVINNKTVFHSILSRIDNSKSSKLNHASYYILPIANTNMIKAIIQSKHYWNTTLIYGLLLITALIPEQ